MFQCPRAASRRRRFGDGTSLLALEPNWQPVVGPGFALKDFVNYALGVGPSLHFR
jgi:hypothetical protein